MALKPDKNDPNYKEQMEQYKLHPERWNRPDLSIVANAAAPARAADYKHPGLKQNEGREHEVERIRRRLLAHHGIRDGIGIGDKSKPIAEMLYGLAGEDESKADYDHKSVRNMLRSAGLLP